MSLMTMVKTNFTAGELSPDILGRGDLAAWQNGALTLRNVLISPVGGLRRRPGLRYIAPLRGAGRLITFSFNTEQSYLLVFTHLKLNIYANDSHMVEIATPWTLAQLDNINWTQSADTLLVVHPDVPPKKITRTTHTQWSLTDWKFYGKSGVIYHPTYKFADPAVTVQASATSGDVTLTASAAVFQAAHVGQQWRLVGKAVKITAVTTATTATAKVVQTLPDTKATTDWEEPSFSPLRGWPASVCFHQDRLVIGGSRDLPNRLWLSKSSDLFNFDLSEGMDDEAIEFALLSDQVNAIKAVFSARHLQVFTSGAEWMVSGDPLTPLNIQVLRQTRVGSIMERTIPPVDVDGATLFAGADGQGLREFLFADVEQAYQSTDLAMLAKHIPMRPVDQDYDPLNRLLHMVMTDGTLATLTLYRSEKVTAWTRWDTAGRFLSLTVMNGTTYVLVQRGNRFCLECFDAALAMDCAIEGRAAAPSVLWSGLGHLDGQVVQVLADDGDISEHTVRDARLTLEYPATTVRIGLPYRMEVVPLPPATPSGAGPGMKVRLVRLTFRLHQTSSLVLDLGRGAEPVPFRRFNRDRFDGSPPPFSGDISLRALGWRNDLTKPLWRVSQDTPLPCGILAVAAEIKYAE